MHVHITAARGFWDEALERDQFLEQVLTARTGIRMDRCRFILCAERLFNQLTVVATLCSRRGVFSPDIPP